MKPGTASISCHWVRDTSALDQMAEVVAQEGFVAVDTEFRRRDTFYPEVALLQLSAAEQCWLIDPLTLTDTSALQTLFLKTDLVKVLLRYFRQSRLSMGMIGIKGPQMQ